ncbi:MAG: alpha-glucosidase C-terminal domain-containing protein [Tidjanibacter sp.]|nr:alpha-glucosidase C-terminal domain-containing protein [Tidjanibacter sp.]
MKLKPLFNLLTAATVSLLSALLFVQCTPAQEFALGNGSAVIPLTVKQGTTTHFLTDYYPQWEGATTLACGDERLQLTPLTDNLDQFKITAQGGPLVSTIDVWHDWNKLSIVVLGGERDTEGSYMSSTKAKRGTITIVASKPVTEAVAMWQNEVIGDVRIDGNTIEVTIPSVAKKHQRSVVRIFAASAEGRFNDVLLPLEYGKVVVDAKDIRRQDFQSQILYSLMIDRFKNGTTANDWKINSPEVLDKVDYQGGDIVGITQKIEEGFFTDLGITTIWISPITQNPYDAWGQNRNPDTKFSGYHGYWPIFSTVIDKRFGTDEELRTMLAEAHKGDMNVILDYVANHLHINSPVLKEHPDWTTDLMLPDGRKNIGLWDGETRLTTWFDEHIPTLDTRREEVCQPMTDSALYWVRKFDFDGFRHDACKHIPLNYWRMLTHKMKSSMPERQLWQIGETYGDVELIGSYVKSGMIDAQFDFNLYHTSRDVIVDESRSMRDIAGAVEEAEAAYGSHHTMGNITGNHDKPRFLSLAGGDMSLWCPDDKAEGWHRKVGVGDNVKGYARLSLMKAIISTVPGVPCVYQGDEYGIPGANDPDNRYMMEFEGYNEFQQKELAATKAMFKYRRASMPLMYGDYRTLYVNDDVFVFLRHYMGQWVVVALNIRPEAHTVEVAMPAMVEATSVEVALSAEGGEATLAGGNLSINIPAYGYVIVNE